MAFHARTVDTSRLREWSAGLLPPLPSDACWQVNASHVDAAIRYAKNTSPGPDGIPYSAYKYFAGSSSVLHACVGDMSSVSFSSLPDGFNHGNLSCLPKKPSGQCEDGSHYYTPEGTRPLSVVNTDNRILASSLRLRSEPIFNAWISGAQRGFLRGRSMIANIMDVDFVARIASFMHSMPALASFDFKAAFPSVSHEYMWAMLELIGVPARAIHAYKCLYVDNRQVVCFRGRRGK